jgi:uncharacterized protein
MGAAAPREGTHAPRSAPSPATRVSARLERLDWDGIERSLGERGWAKTDVPVLTPQECADLIALYDDDSRFRSRVDMQRFHFGLGEYKYFGAPLPPLVRALRESAYPRLAAIANGWMDLLGQSRRFPPTLRGFLTACHRAGQTRPTPLLLRYATGGFNCMHQDLYGELVFPLQLTCVLSRRGPDYTGGDFLLTEQRPRQQSRGESIALEQGEIIVFTTRERPARGARGPVRAAMRHGVSRLLSGTRYSLGVIFHDAR